MEKLTQIMNSFEKFLEAYDTCSKSEVIYHWSALKKEIEKILEEKVIPQEVKEQIIKNDCGVKYHISEGGVLTPIKETEINSWQDGNVRKWKCGCGSLMECETGSDSVITCLRCYRKYAWEDRSKRLTYITEVGEDDILKLKL